MKKMTIAEATAYIRENAESLDYNKNECFALRSDDVIPEGEKFWNSFERLDGIKGEELPGVCASYLCENDMFGDYEEAEIPQRLIGYYGKHTFLLVGEKINDEIGNDDWNKEIILRNHRIIAEIVEEVEE